LGYIMHLGIFCFSWNGLNQLKKVQKSRIASLWIIVLLKISLNMLTQLARLLLISNKKMQGNYNIGFMELCFTLDRWIQDITLHTPWRTINGHTTTMKKSQKKSRPLMWSPIRMHTFFSTSSYNDKNFIYFVYS